MEPRTKLFSPDLLKTTSYRVKLKIISLIKLMYVVVVGLKPIVRMWYLGLWWGALREGLFKGS